MVYFPKLCQTGEGEKRRLKRRPERPIEGNPHRKKKKTRAPPYDYLTGGHTWREERFLRFGKEGEKIWLWREDSTSKWRGRRSLKSALDRAISALASEKQVRLGTKKKVCRGKIKQNEVTSWAGSNSREKSRCMDPKGLQKQQLYGDCRSRLAGGVDPGGKTNQGLETHSMLDL